eukprot:scaffold3319_cov427-Prasinococcus_capsulatus_cf.AAC.6
MAVEDPAQQVLTIKAMLPSCDVANLILERPSILSLSKEVLAHRIEAVRGLMPDAATEDVDSFIAQQPNALEKGQLAQALEQMRRLMPTANHTSMLLRDPDCMLCFQPLKAQSRGDRDWDALGRPTT